MKTMKHTMKCLIAVFTMVMVFTLTGITAQATAAPSKPASLNLYAADVRKDSSTRNTFFLQWNFDSYAYNNYYYNYIDFGYEVEIKTLKNKKIKNIDANTINLLLGTYNNGTSFGVEVTNSKLAKQGFKFRVRAYSIDPTTGQRVYSAYSKEKVIIPRATITSKKIAGKNGAKITWSKVTGAKSYTIYLSKEGGKFKKLKTTTARSYTMKNLAQYTDYYVYVQVNDVKYKNKKYDSTKFTTSDKTMGVDSFYIYTRTTYY